MERAATMIRTRSVFARLAQPGLARGIVSTLEWVCAYLCVALACELLLGTFVGSTIVTTLACDTALVTCTLCAVRVKRAPGAPSGTFCVGLCFLTCLVWTVGSISSTYVHLAFNDTSFVATQASSGGALYQVFVLAFAPVLEELMFRAGLYGQLRRGHGAVASTLLSASVFALVHGTLTHLPMTFLLGCLCVFAYEHGGIVASVVVHVAANALSYFVAPRLAMPAWLFSPALVMGLFVVVAGLLLILQWMGDGHASDVE